MKKTAIAALMPIIYVLLLAATAICSDTGLQDFQDRDRFTHTDVNALIHAIDDNFARIVANAAAVATKQDAISGLTALDLSTLTTLTLPTLIYYADTSSRSYFPSPAPAAATFWRWATKPTGEADWDDTISWYRHATDYMGLTFNTSILSSGGYARIGLNNDSGYLWFSAHSGEVANYGAGAKFFANSYPGGEAGTIQFFAGESAYVGGIAADGVWTIPAVGIKIGAGLRMVEDDDCIDQTADGLCASSTGQLFWRDVSAETTRPIPGAASQAEMEAGTEAGLRFVSPLSVKQAIDAHAPASGDRLTEGVTQLVFGAADTTPDVSNGTASLVRSWTTGGAVTITDFDDGDDHSEFSLGDWFLLEADHGAILDLSNNPNLYGWGNSDYTLAAGETVMCWYNGTKWLITIGDNGWAGQNISPLAADGEYAGVTRTYTVDEAVNNVFGQVYACGQADGNCDAADLDHATAAFRVPTGLAVEGGSGTKKILVKGEIREDDWAWTVGGNVYLSTDPTTTEGLTQSLSERNPVWVIGHATSADSIFVDIRRGPEIYRKSITFDPVAVCDGDWDGLDLGAVGDEGANGIQIVQWALRFNDADPTTELDVDLYRADGHPGRANAVLMDVLDTTAGASAEDTDANINGGAAVATGKVIYLLVGTPYAETGHQCTFEYWWRRVE